MADEALSKQPEDTPAAEDTGFSEAFAAGAAGERPKPEESEPSDSPTDEGAAKAPSEEQAGQDDGDKPDPKPADAEEERKFDPFAGLSPEQLEHFKRLEQSDRSQRGRVSALTLKLREAATSMSPKPKTAEDAEAQAKELEELEQEVAKAAEEYPEAAGPLAKKLQRVMDRVDAVAAKVDPIIENQSKAELAAAYEVLAEAHPDYAEVAKSNEFLEWAEVQSPAVQALVTSIDPDDVSTALTKFKAATGKTTQQPPESKDEGGGKSEQDAKRERQLDGARDVPAKGPGAAAGTPNDFSAAFQERASRYAKA